MTTTLEQRYQLEAEIAAGAAGTVWRARDLTTGTPVAVKLLHPSAAAQPDVVEAFREEARVLGEVRHPGVVRPREFLHTPDGQYALVMDLVAGRDLRRLLIADGPLAPAAAASVLAQVAAAISAVHAAGIVHGDVKPGNILVPEPPGTDGVRLVDFGVAQRLQRPTGATHATPEYVAPEVVAGRPPVPASDVYGIGIVAYEALSGRSPFRGGTIDEVLRRHHGWTVVQLPGVPEPLWQLINRCLELDPAARPTAGELSVRLTDLAPELVGLPPVALAPGSPTLRPRDDREPTDGGFVSLDSLLGPAPAASTSTAVRPAEVTEVRPPEPAAVPVEPVRSGQVPVAEPAPWRSHREPAAGGNRTKLLLGAAAGVVLVALLVLGGWMLLGGGTDQPAPPAADRTHPSASTPARQHRSPSPPPASPSGTPGSGGAQSGGDGSGPGDGQGDGSRPGDGQGDGNGGTGTDGNGGTGAGPGPGSGGTAGDLPSIGAPMPTMGAIGG